ncbi:cell division protein FtsI/penicillin-binding protein 2 [secondary endosymbiont of Heteropsylla cubana]|uniref:Cell division protein FtsI/penicillin-binding protein 2 n=1 Tax=secondary endosymbiont of Heteropsylla cubana TaxID=134287 RepID=J3TGR7_9ENTR|nr:cell division protein FtsI/penicillin-binding protein 2 [secondary endosymbiont of Heteropsylla cubana]
MHEGDVRSLRIQPIPIERGIISDRAEHLIAINVPVKAVLADPKELHNHNGIAPTNNRLGVLSNILSIPIDQISSLINKHKKRFAYLARQVNPAIGDYIHTLKLPGIYLLQESRRYYPTSHVTAHLVGITNIDSQGIEGVEKKF